MNKERDNEMVGERETMKGPIRNDPFEASATQTRWFHPSIIHPRIVRPPTDCFLVAFYNWSIHTSVRT